MHDHPDVKAYRKIDGIPFDFERRRISIVVGKDGDRQLIVKGAPEGVLSLCVRYEVDGASRLMDADAHVKCQNTYQSLSAQGYRVVAVVTRSVPAQDAYRVADEKDLTLLGYLAFIDPPLPDAPTRCKT